MRRKVHTGWNLHHWCFWTSQSRVWSLTMYIEACHVSPASNTQRLESQTCQSVPVCSRPPRPAPTNMRGCWQHSWWLIFHTTPYLSTILANMSGCAVFYSNVTISRQRVLKTDHFCTQIPTRAISRCFGFSWYTNFANSL